MDSYSALGKLYRRFSSFPFFKIVCTTVFIDSALKTDFLIGFSMALFLMVTNASQISTQVYLQHANFVRWHLNFHLSQFTKALS